MNQHLFILLLLAHFIGDFLFQGRQMANNKSSNIYWLLTHGISYMIPLLIVFLFICPFKTALILTGINVGTHICIDWITGKYTGNFYKQQKFYYFFSTIGFDQFLHLTILYLSFYGCN